VIRYLDEGDIREAVMAALRIIFIAISVGTLSTIEVTLLAMWAHDLLVGWSRTLTWLP
jgi:hypothetical protein